MKEGIDPGATSLNTDLLERYLAGECSESEREVVGAWLETQPRMSSGFQALQNHYTLAAVGAPSTDIRGIEDALVRKLGQISAVVPVEVEDYSRGSLRRWVGYGAFTLVAIVALFIGLGIKSERTPSVTTTIYLTRAAERAEVHLADGTRVMLNVASRLEVPSDFGKSNRTIVLNGEASFHVTHSGGQPFIVKTANTETRVLGTKFGVRAYDANVRVAVADGKVSFESTVLSAGSMASIVNSQVHVEKSSDVASMLAWTDGNLVIQDIPLKKAVADLERWYNVQIHLDDASLGDRPLRATLKAGTPSDLAEILQLAFRVPVQLTGRTITINRNTP